MPVYAKLTNAGLLTVANLSPDNVIMPPKAMSSLIRILVPLIINDKSVAVARIVKPPAPFALIKSGLLLLPVV